MVLFLGEQSPGSLSLRVLTYSLKGRTQTQSSCSQGLVITEALLIYFPFLCMTSPFTPGNPFSPQWPASLWCIWKFRCSHVLSAETSSSSETLCMIWTELIHTLRSQWDSSAGSSRTQERHRLEFIRHWGRTSLFFSHTSGSVTWHYAPPEWFLLHSSYQPP